MIRPTIRGKKYLSDYIIGLMPTSDYIIGLMPTSLLQRCSDRLSLCYKMIRPTIRKTKGQGQGW